jgi:hypothetical protein
MSMSKDNEIPPVYLILCPHSVWWTQDYERAEATVREEGGAVVILWPIAYESIRERYRATERHHDEDT